MTGEETLQLDEPVEVEESEHLEVVDLDQTTADFEENFGEIDGGWRDLGPFTYLKEKDLEAEDYGMAAVMGTAPPAMFLAYANPSILATPLVLGAGAAPFIGQEIGERMNSLDDSANEKFVGEYREFEDFGEVERILSSSDKVEYGETSGVPWVPADPTPENAARDYEDLIGLLREENNYWESELDAENYERLTKKERDILAAYDPKNDETDLLSIEGLENLQEHQRKLLADAEEKVKETEINQYLRVTKVNNPSYNGTAYQLEVYQGEGLQFSVKGVTPEDITEVGQEVNFIDSIQD